MSGSEIVPSRPIFSSGSNVNSFVKKNPKKRRKNDGKVKKGGKKKKNANNKKDEKEPKEDREADEDSDVDIDKELKPIGAYIDNREVMLEHVFRSVKEHKLQSLLPDILKNVPIDELRVQCCHQLEGMSKMRIRHIIAGEEMYSSSGTEESNSDNNRMSDVDKQVENQTSPDTSTVVHSTCDSQGEGDYRSVGSTQDEVANTIVSTADDTYKAQVSPGDGNENDVDECSPIKSEQEDEEEREEEKESVTSEELEEGSEEGEVRSMRHDIHENSPAKNIMENEKNSQVSGNFFEEGDEEGEAGTVPSENDSDIGVDLSNPKGGNLEVNVADQSASSSKPSSELEILELELRARAIRSLMQKVAQNKDRK